MNASRTRWYSVSMLILGALTALGCDDGGGTAQSGSGTGSGAGVTPGMAPDGASLLIFSLMEAELPADTGYFYDPIYGFEGAWFTYNDMTSTGTQTPVAMGKFEGESTDREGGGLYAARTHGSGFATWGAGMGFNIRVPAEATSPLPPEAQCVPATAGAPCPFDASLFTGISFWAKLGEGASHEVTIKTVTAPIALPANGGNCAPAGGKECNDAHSAKLTGISSVWQYYSFTWDTLKQEGWGVAVTALDTTQFIGLQFQTPASVAFDLWVDDVAFLTP